MESGPFRHGNIHRLLQLGPTLCLVGPAVTLPVWAQASPSPSLICFSVQQAQVTYRAYCHPFNDSVHISDWRLSDGALIPRRCWHG